MALIGGCNCGNVRYEIRKEPIFAHACHCRDCQRSTGSAFVIHSVVLKEDFKIEGDTKSTTLPTGSGAGYDPHFCANCGTYIWCKYHFSSLPTIALRTTTLDDTSIISPQAHIFTKYKQPWLTLSEDIPAFEEFYVRDEVWPAAGLDRINCYKPYKPRFLR